MINFTLGFWYEIVTIGLFFSISYMTYQNYLNSIEIHTLLRMISKNTERRKSDRRKVKMSVDEERRLATRRDAEVSRLHSLYHEGDVNIAPSYAEKILNKNSQ